MKRFIQNFFVRPPVIFPLVACFLLFLSIHEVSLSMFTAEVDPLHKLRAVFMVLMTIFWFGATFFQRWGAIGFVVLTICSLGAYFFSEQPIIKGLFGNILILPLPIKQGVVPIPLSAIFVFIALYFYSRMD